jgi:hypothetical protein
VAGHSSTVLMDLVRASRGGGLAAALLTHGRVEIGVALGLVQFERYLMIAGATFYIIGNLRLLGFNLASGYHYPYLSRSFVDLWQRTNFYVRECQLVLYYVPLAKLLRHHLGQRLTAGIATTGAIAGHLVLAILVSHLIMVGWSSEGPLQRMLFDSGRFAVVGLLTIVSVVRRHRAEHELRLSWPRRIWQIVFVMSITVANLAVWELLMQGLTWAQTVTVLRFVVLGQAP